MRSWAGRLALIGLPALTMLFALNATTAYRDIRDATHGAHDRALRAALVLLQAQPQSSEHTRHRIAASLGTEVDEVHFAVIGPDGKALAGEGDLPYLSADTDTTPRFRAAHYRGRAVRIAALRAGGSDYVVAESAATRIESIHRLFLADLSRQSWLVVLGGLLAWIGLRSARRDLKHLADLLTQREAEDLTPLVADDLPAETRPLVTAVDSHLTRLASLLEASRRFAADVAHQLRTPLTLLGAQAQYGLRQDDPVRLRETVEGIAAASRAAQRLCNQMLSLSRVEAAKGVVRDGARLDLATLVRETALDLGMLALEKRIDLGYEGVAAQAPVVGNEIMLHEMFANLIDNALRYTPCEGKVVVSLQCSGSQVQVEVADSGPGIPAEARVAMFQRFHRRLDRAGRSGAGLGLAIAHQIALAHGGALELDDRSDGCGLVARVSLPLCA